jgi:putative flippase GtrA
MPIRQMSARPAGLILRFGVVGLINTAFGYAVFVALTKLGSGSGLALVGATIAGIAFNFQTMRRLVFRADGGIARFVLVYGGTLLINWIALHMLLAYGLTAMGAQAVLTLPLAGISFMAQRFFVFNERSGSVAVLQRLQE